MTRAEMLALLRAIEWSGYGVEEEGLAICPHCIAEPKDKRHNEDCKLAAAISWLEDDVNSVHHMPIDAKKGWVLF